jgi:hypothetical protein
MEKYIKFLIGAILVIVGMVTSVSVLLDLLFNTQIWAERVHHTELLDLNILICGVITSTIGLIKMQTYYKK